VINGKQDAPTGFGHLDFDHSGLFRISDFDIRI